MQKLKAQIANVKVADVVPCDSVRLLPLHGNPNIVDWNPNDPASEFIMSLMGVDNIIREAPVVDSRRASSKTIAGGQDPYLEFDPKYFTKSEKIRNPLYQSARLDAHFLKLVESKDGGMGDVTDDLVNRKTLTKELYRGKVNAFTKGKSPRIKVEFESTFDGNECLAFGPDLNG